MTIESFSAWLARRPKGPAPKKPIPKRTKKRAAQESQYNRLAKRFIRDHPICQVWLKENGWTQDAGPLLLFQHPTLPGSNVYMMTTLFKAPRSEEVHHMAKRRGDMLLDVTKFLAVSHANHQRIEQNLSWARAEGFSLNF